jgi:hypothetical protein
MIIRKRMLEINIRYVNCKQFIHIVKFIYKVELPRIQIPNNLHDMINDPNFVYVFDDKKFRDCLHETRKLGNAAAHGNHDAAYMALLDGITGNP